MVHVSSAAASKAGHGSHGPGKSEFSLKLSWQPRSLGLGATYIPLSRLMQQLARLAPCVRPSFARQVHTHPTCKKIDIIQAAHQCQLIHAAERIYHATPTHSPTYGGGGRGGPTYLPSSYIYVHLAITLTLAERRPQCHRLPACRPEPITRRLEIVVVDLLPSPAYARSPRMRRASWTSLGMMVTRLPWMAQRLVSSNRPTR